MKKVKKFQNINSTSEKWSRSRRSLFNKIIPFLKSEAKELQPLYIEPLAEKEW